ncbi:gamma-glutamyltransferase [Aidingimonas lacisalsi]|uniref:gamma-glutamyltransferase n=1 Tax=Aidingimonas lacisalsi TaxID=2604086 RepID=UPI0011D1A60B|nr:gamma-glutamyltransferase [Aidingimonas lacisalsi]
MVFHLRPVTSGLMATALLLMTALHALDAHAQSAILEGERFHPEQASHGMVASSHTLATDIARDVMADGGNAVDGAVVAGFVLAVVQPRSGNIGGGGFMLISDENSDDVVAIDYRETAPAAATETMFQNEAGNAVSDWSRYTHRASGVPGTVAGLALALDAYGTLSLAEAMEPAIRLAEDGFKVPPRFAAGLDEARDRLSAWESTRQVFFKEDGSRYRAGDTFRQPDLAATLTRIAEHGPREFYAGKTAELLVAEMERNDGLITMDDMAGYEPQIREPIHGTYRGHDIYAMSPPSSGGVHIVQMLNMLENDDIAALGHNSASTLHLMAESMKRAYADRSKFLGDTDFVDVPLSGLTAKAYATHLRDQIDPQHATPSDDIGPDDPWPYESGETTHYSIADDNGLMVSNTYTINFSYGSGIVVDGAGFLLNNEMDDFSAKPGEPNAYGLIGGEANKIEPGKRMLSSMTPTIVKRDGKNLLATGTPGGSRIITTTLQVVMNVIDHGMNIQSAVSAPRIHHQWLPDEIAIEAGISPDTIDRLEAKGHRIEPTRAMGAAQSVMVDAGLFLGGTDPRRSTSKAAGW